MNQPKDKIETATVEFWNVLELLENTRSIVDKRQIISEIKKDEILWGYFETFFRACYDKNVLYGIKTIPLPNSFVEGLGNPTDVFLFVETINQGEKRLTPTQIVENLQHFPFTVKQFDLLERILARDPRCNIGQTLFEDFFEDKESLEFEAKLMKAQSYSEKALKAIKFPAYVQHKLDGSRCLAMVSDKGKVTFYSGNGKVFNGLDRLEIAIRELYCNSSILDGEILVFDDDFVKPLDRKTGNGILNKSLKNTITSSEAANVGFIIWDFIELDEYNSGKGKETYQERFEKLKRQFDKYEPIRNPMVQLVKTDIAETKEQAIEIFSEYLRGGHEGVILKDFRGVWEHKRSKFQVKMKQELIITLKVIGFEYGAPKSKYEGLLGALCCESLEGKIKVNVGSGLTDEQRLNPELFEGVCIDVKCNGVIQSKEEDKPTSLFLPRFVEIRHDKNECDSVEYILSQDVTYNALKEK